MGTTASCHRVTHDPIQIVDNKINFHNIPQKLEARTKMLNGQWPGRGCEHCKLTEDAGGHSDRMNHLDMQGVYAPPELEKNLNAVNVTPTQLEIYFSNTCNLKCIYCNSKFSSTIDNENRLHGEFHWGEYALGKNVWLPGKLGTDVQWGDHKEINDLYSEASALSDKLFDWLNENIKNLKKIMILGGEPFLQKETERLIKFLENSNNPELTLVIFSNLTVDTIKVQNWLARMWDLVAKRKIYNLQVVGSLDCWGPQAEYVRNGLNLEKFVSNFEYMLSKTKITVSINSALMALTVPTMPDLVKQINSWSRQYRPVYWSMMKAGDVRRPYLNPTIFGDKILNLGVNETIDLFDTQNDPIKKGYLNNLKGIAKECEKTEPNLLHQQQLKVYLKELDRRRNTNYETLFPSIAELLNHV
jgi:pyruvate-formate lyase-activating enzyme